MRKSMFDNTVLTFSIPYEGYVDENTGKWTIPNSDKRLVKGDLQPYVRTGSSQVVEVEGFKLIDAKMFITPEQLPTIEEFGNTMAATTTIKGRVYYVATKFDFLDGPLNTDTIFYILSLHKLPEV